MARKRKKHPKKKGNVNELPLPPKFSKKKKSKKQKEEPLPPKIEQKITPAAAETSKPKPHIDLVHKKPLPVNKIVENYEIEANQTKIKVEIKNGVLGLKYNLILPPISPATLALLSEIRNELVSLTTISMKELTNQESFQSIKEKFTTVAKGLIKKKLPHLSPESEAYLLGNLMQEMLGLGKIEFLIADSSLEEIVINSATESVRVYSKKHGWLETNIMLEKEDLTVNYSNIIARRVGRQINVLSPLLDAHLITGDRINAVLYPINTKGNTITIRKFARDPFTIVDLINNKTCDLKSSALIWLAIEYEMNVLISGGTGSGKTSFLNACMPFIPPNQRIISIEDTRELMLPEFLYWTPLVTRMPNPEGKGAVTMLNLLVNSLRMRPDRIVLGEMRKKEEATVLFEAMHTGHSVYATVHADTAQETISRLINPPLSVPPNLLKAVNLNIVMFRDRRRGIRRILQLAEYDATKQSPTSNLIYRWVRERDEIVKHGATSSFFENVSRHTGMTEAEINKDLEMKKNILKTLINNKIRSLEELGRIFNMYYRNKPLLLELIRKNKIKDALKI
tara:strand:- start:6208 stop:7905 length:1698 start_codon:yes stop_codon:yes gene_type:complete